MRGREVEIDGTNNPSVSAVEVEPGVFSVLHNGKSYVARAVPGGVEVDGEMFVTEFIDPRAASPRRSHSGTEGRQQVTAPMPGKVIRISVSLGDEVEPGQGLLVIEAMKMQNEMKAARAGKVVSLPVQEGSAVAAGDVLAVIE